MLRLSFNVIQTNKNIDNNDQTYFQMFCRVWFGSDFDFFCNLWGKCLLVEITFDVFKFFQNQYSARAVIEAGRYLSEVPSSIL